MPSMSVEKVREIEGRLAKELADKGDSLDQAERRALHKKLRRAQRKRRRLIAAAEKAAAARPKPAAEAKPAEAEAPAEEEKSDG